MILVSDILEEVKEAAGNCDNGIVYRTLTRAVELLSNKKLIDPLKGTVDFSLDGSYYVALPRDVKTPLRINIEGNPSFARSRLFEFTQNTNGSEEGEEIGWSWHERGYVCTQNEKALPSKLKYVATNAADAGKTCDITGLDSEGRTFTETLTASLIGGAEESEGIFTQVVKIVREATAHECQLVTPETVTVARYYGDETLPEYRLIKLSKTAVAIRMHYIRKTFKVTGPNDIIPIHSAQAVILMVQAVRAYARGEIQVALPYEESAARILKEEQATREMHETTSGDTEVQTATDTNISSVEGLIAADVYDAASGIYGPIGREKIFDKITTAAETLMNKAQWTGMIGWCDIWKSENLYEVNNVGAGNGLFVLPRWIGPILSLNMNGFPSRPRNTWFEFHLNGNGERNHSDSRTWDEMPETCVIAQPPLDPITRLVIPQQLALVCESKSDLGKTARVFGMEQTLEGDERDIYRDGKRGFLLTAAYEPAYLSTCPRVTRITGFEKSKTTGFLRLFMRNACVHIAAVGDGGMDNQDAKNVSILVRNRKASDVILLGDINYDTGSASTIDDNVGEQWRPYIYPFLGDTTDAPLTGSDTDATENHCWPVPGNHDWRTSQDDTTATGSYSISAAWTGPEQYRVRYFNYLHEDALIGGAPPTLKERFEGYNGPLLETITGQYTGRLKEYTFTLADGSVLTFGNATNSFGDNITVTRRVPQHNLTPYLDYFTLPGNGRYYTRVFGELEVFFLDSDPREPDGATMGSKQYLWLKARIAESKARWKIVALHHSPYGSTFTHEDEGQMRWDFENMGIHAVIGGHRHVYERMERNGVVYITAGTGGRELVDFRGSGQWVAVGKMQSINNANLIQVLMDIDAPIPAKGQIIRNTTTEALTRVAAVNVIAYQYNQRLAEITLVDTSTWSPNDLVDIFNEPQIIYGLGVGLNPNPLTPSSATLTYSLPGIIIEAGDVIYNGETTQTANVLSVTHPDGSTTIAVLDVPNFFGEVNVTFSIFKEMYNPVDDGSAARVKAFGSLFILANASKLRLEFRVIGQQIQDVREFTTTIEDKETLAGYYYPDETQPRYRVIKVATGKETRLRLQYRRRPLRISSLHDPIPLRSRRALELAMQAEKDFPTDPKAAEIMEAKAVDLLREEQLSANPNAVMSLQVDEDSGAFVTDNIT